MMYTEKKKPKRTKKAKKPINPNYPNKKVTIIIVVIAILILLSLAIYRIRDNKKYQGYWCNYEERASIVVLLKEGHTEKQIEELLEKVEEFDNVLNVNYNPKDVIEAQLGTETDILDAYQISFSSLDSIGTYIEELKEFDVVVDATQEIAKINMSLYNLQAWGKYTFTDSDEAEEEDIETGKYQIKNGVIVFTPKDKKNETKMLYIKNDHLCFDSDCTKVFATSNETCGTDN